MVLTVFDFRYTWHFLYPNSHPFTATLPVMSETTNLATANVVNQSLVQAAAILEGEMKSMLSMHINEILQSQTMKKVLNAVLSIGINSC